MNLNRIKFDSDCAVAAGRKITYTQWYRIFRRLTRGDGYQPWGYDWPTLRITMPGLYALWHQRAK